MYASSATTVEPSASVTVEPYSPTNCGPTPPLAVGPVARRAPAGVGDPAGRARPSGDISPPLDPPHAAATTRRMITSGPSGATFTPVAVVGIDSRVPGQPVASTAAGLVEEPDQVGPGVRDPRNESCRSDIRAARPPRRSATPGPGWSRTRRADRGRAWRGGRRARRTRSASTSPGAGRRDAAGAAGRGVRRRVESTQTRLAIVRTQWRAGPSAWYRCSDPIARSNVSWARSSAVSGSPRYRHIFQTSRWVSAMNRSRAAWSPSRAAIRSCVR